MEERLNEIMKPYFEKIAEMTALTKDKEEELSKTSPDAARLLRERRLQTEEAIKQNKEKIAELIEKRKLEKKQLELRLEKLRENKEEEINKFILEQSPFYAGYGAALRKDLEQMYKLKEEELLTQIESFDAKTQDKIKELEDKLNEQPYMNREKYPVDMSDAKNLIEQLKEARTNKSDLEKSLKGKEYSEKDLIEMVAIKRKVRDQIVSEIIPKRIELENELEQEKINLKQILLDISRFKYEYNAQNQIINADKFRSLTQKSDEIRIKISNIESYLNKITQSLSLLEFTKEEEPYLMRSNLPYASIDVDKAEKNNTSDSKVSDNNDSTADVKENETNDSVDVNEEDSDVIEEIESDVEPDYEEDKKGNITVETQDDLLQTLYNEIIDEMENLRTVRINGSNGKLGKDGRYVYSREGLDSNYSNIGEIVSKDDKSIQLANGEYLYSSDFDQAIDKLYNKKKGKTYKVRETGKNFKITYRTLDKFKSQLKDAAILSLKAKENSEDKLLFGGPSNREQVQLGEINQTNLPEGSYLLKSDVIDKLNSVFARTRLDSLRNFASKLKKKIKETKENDSIEEVNNEQNDYTEDFKKTVADAAQKILAAPNDEQSEQQRVEGSIYAEDNDSDYEIPGSGDSILTDSDEEEKSKTR